MQRSAESERYVDCSGHIVLECECGEKLVLLGLEDDWRSKDDPLIFECECGEELTLADRSWTGAKATIRRLIKGSIGTSGAQ